MSDSGLSLLLTPQRLATTDTRLRPFSHHRLTGPPTLPMPEFRFSHSLLASVRLPRADSVWLAVLAFAGNMWTKDSKPHSQRVPASADISIPTSEAVLCNLSPGSPRYCDHYCYCYCYSDYYNYYYDYVC